MNRYVVVSKSPKQGTFYYECNAKTLYRTDYSKPESIAMYPPFFFPIILFYVISLSVIYYILKLDIPSKDILIIMNTVWVGSLLFLYLKYNRSMSKKFAKQEPVVISHLNTDEAYRLINTLERNSSSLYLTVNRFLVGFYFCIAGFIMLFLNYLSNINFMHINLGINSPNEVRACFYALLLTLEIIIYIWSFSSPRRRKMIITQLKKQIHNFI